MDIKNTELASPWPHEAELVARMLRGEEDAFEEAVRTYGPHMLAVARRFLGQEQDAQDVAQEAFVSAFSNLSSFHGQSRLRTWLHRIVVNAALSRLRARARETEQPIDDLLPTYQADGHMRSAIEEWAVTYDTASADAEMRELVRRSIDRLPETFRAVLLLRDIEGLSTEQTAEALGISVSNVKVRLHRARQALRTLLDPYMRGATP